MSEPENFGDFFKKIEAKSIEPKISLETILERAYDIRKFEIDLYWKRATYFWGFLVASFTAYFIVTDSAKFGNKKYYEFLVACIGYIFSLSWYLVNRGSKYWQANWEKIIDTLEAKLKIPLYRMNLHNEHRPGNVFQRYPYSVSRINIIVSFYIVIVWLILIFKFFVELFIIFKNRVCIECCPCETICFYFGKPETYYILAILLLTSIITYFLLVDGKTAKDSLDTYYFKQRFSEYHDPREESKE